MMIIEVHDSFIFIQILVPEIFLSIFLAITKHSAVISYIFQKNISENATFKIFQRALFITALQ